MNEFPVAPSTAEVSHTWGKSNITLIDVAREAGVSQSAASVVLNGARSGTGVSSERRQKILEAAQRLGYRPNALARSLTKGRTNLIGVYSGRSRLDSRNSFFAELIGGCSEASDEFGLDTVLHARRDPGALLSFVSNRLLDGLVVHAPAGDLILKILGEFRVPAVAVADVIEGLPSVVVDDAAGGALQAHHLAALGHKSVLVKQAQYPPWSAVARVGSFINTAESLGIHVHQRHVAQGGEGALDTEELRLLTAGSDRVSAIVAWNDHVAQSLCANLDSLGMAIPAEVAVLGFNGFQYACWPRYNLTTINAPWADVGRIAVRHLAALIEHRSVPSQTIVPVQFVRGETT